MLRIYLLLLNKLGDCADICCFFFVLFLEMENNVIDFDKLTFEEKKNMVISGIMKGTNFNDLSASTLDWSSSMPGLTVPAEMVLTEIRMLDFNRICSELKGKKSVKEVFQIVF